MVDWLWGGGGEEESEVYDDFHVSHLDVWIYGGSNKGEGEK